MVRNCSSTGNWRISDELVLISLQQQPRAQMFIPTLAMSQKTLLSNHLLRIKKVSVKPE